jgi:hypothetical protein
VFTVNHRVRALYQRLGMTEVARHGDSNVKITMRSGHPGQTAKDQSTGLDNNSRTAGFERCWDWPAQCGQLNARGLSEEAGHGCGGNAR